MTALIFPRLLGGLLQAVLRLQIRNLAPDARRFETTDHLRADKSDEESVAWIPWSTYLR